MTEQAFWTYILASRKHGTLYVGHTSNLSQRVEHHRAEAVPGFTRKYHVHRLVHAEPFANREDARQREHSLKRWPRAWKVQLIEADNPNWDDLFDRYGA